MNQNIGCVIVSLAMKIIRVANPGSSQILVEDEAPAPKPGRDEVLIKVAAAGVMLTELSWPSTSHKKNDEPRPGAIPGHEFSGIVAEVGEDVGDLEVGHQVFGMNDWFADGAMAEYCVAPWFAIAPKPGNLTLAQAASVPISALTAWQGLLDHARLRRGEHVLIHGGAGAVGIFAIQIAHLFGAHVIATTSARNHDFVSRLGAERVLDPRVSRFEDFAKDMDVVFDTVGGETLARSWAVLKPDGRMVTIVSTEANSSDPRVKKAFFIVEPNQKQLVEIAHLLDANKLRPVVDTVIPMSQVPDLFAGKVKRQGRGKLVVSVAEIYS
jgi:NADPH:quinone reductase-like Zn-dependent oxidoreductase